MNKHSGPNFSTRPVVRVDLKALKENYDYLQKRVGKNTKVAASVKADAYGLGAERISRALYGAGCRTFFVATAGEGKIVRQAIGENASIYVLNGPAPRDLTLYFGSRLKPVINSILQARMWSAAVDGVKSPPFSAIHIDTGMNRLGFPDTEFEQLLRNKRLRESLQADLIMSHLACAPDSSNAYNQLQLEKFQKQAAKLPLSPLSLANTAGIYLGSKYHFQMVRPGIGLYGGVATENPDNETVKPVVSLMAPVLQIRNLGVSERLGYNSTFIAQEATNVAIVGAGYADGLSTTLSSDGQTPGGYATFQGVRVPIIGRISMDLTALDISKMKKPPRIGDWAEFLGTNLETDALSAKALNYELLTRIGSRARREYK